MRRLLLLPVVAVAALSACGEPAVDTGGGGGDGSFEGTWELVEGSSPQGPIEVPDATRITLLITEESFGGWAACNHYGTEDFAIEGSDLEVEGFGMTQIGCDEATTAAQDRYVEALGDANRIERADDTLSLSGPGVELTFALLPPPPTQDLIGTTWELQAMLVGSDETGIAMSVQPATLTLHEDGTLTGTTGCRTLEGDWKESGDEIVFPNFGAVGGCSESVQDQDGHVVSMGDGFTFEIDGDRLTIDPRLGSARLVYRASSE